MARMMTQAQIFKMVHDLEVLLCFELMNLRKLLQCFSVKAIHDSVLSSKCLVRVR